MHATGVTARELEAAGTDLARRRKRVRDAAYLAASCAFVALLTLPWSTAAAIALAGGAVVGGLMAVCGELARQDVIARLALDPLAHELPDVSRYVSRLTHGLERERLADWIREILLEAAYLPGNWYVVHRVIRYADELAALGDDLADPHAEIRPASAAAAHLLLTQAVDSPLYNPALPDDLLPTMITKIRLGISRVPG
jgi:hypothetical protein